MTSLFGLPEKVEHCKKCLLTNQKPFSVNETKNFKGSKKNGKRIYNNSQRKKIIAAESRQNSTNATKKFLSKNNISKVIRLGSSLKLCALAEGKIDIYPRFNGTKEWDTAAAHIVCNEAGCKVLDIETNKELIYNKESIKNNFFIASRKDLSYL